MTGVSAPRCFTKEEPLINLVRGAFSALGCALGGVQGMWLSGFDEAFATPTEEASRLALRTMQILAEETGVTSTIDPLGGGYFTEHLTNRMAEMMLEHIDEIDQQGGAIAATDSGYLRRRMTETDMLWIRQREEGTRHIVAHNIYAGDQADQPSIEFQRFRPEVRRDQVARLQEVRRSRNEGEVATALRAVRSAAESTDNVMPSIVHAVRQLATVGEIMSELTAVFGEWQEPRL